MPEGIKKKHMKLQKNFQTYLKTATDFCNKLQKVKAVNTILYSVAEYFKSFGLNVIKDFDNVNYVIVEA